ncbi:sigma-70 family RNA polymerase sigma factor [Thalassotalea sp. G20_0]|nr:sigma-70 family RNA polymerase sigma factor [Thalassotalea sp. G20_0]
MKGKTKLREVFRLKFEHHLSERKIAQSCNISRSTVKDYLARLSVSELN